MRMYSQCGHFSNRLSVTAWIPWILRKLLESPPSARFFHRRSRNYVKIKPKVDFIHLIPTQYDDFHGNNSLSNHLELLCRLIR